MEQFIIQREIKFGGVFRTLFHESLKPSKNNSVMNVYVENVESDKGKAKVFYSKQEVDAMAVYLENATSDNSKSTVIKIK